MAELVNRIDSPLLFASRESWMVGENDPMDRLHPLDGEGFSMEGP